jgi:Domain of unknown function (DUF6430)
MKLFHSIRLGIQRRPLKFFVEVFLVYSALWTVIESFSSFFPRAKLQGEIYYLTLLSISFLVACARAAQNRTVKFKVGHSNTTIQISFGDIFRKEGHIAIPVNEYFDSELGVPVSPRSLHGLMINRFFGGQSAAFDKLVAAELATTASNLVQRSGGKSNRYVIGTTVSIKTNSHRFLPFALTETNIETFKATATVPQLVMAIQGLCSKARIVLGGDTLVLPLVGTGLSGVGLPANQVLQLILLVLVDETKKNQVSPNLEVVIHPSRFDEIDLSLVKSFWIQ